MIKTQYDLQLAAQATAIKNLDAPDERHATLTLLNDFDELKIDDSFFPTFRDMVENRGNALRNLRQQPLVVPLKIVVDAPAA